MPLPITFLPDRDWRNEGWTLVGSSVAKLVDALSNDDDTKYIKTPNSKVGAAVAFPIDTTTVPEGAVITSVTIKMRCATGTGSAPAGTAPSVTVSVAASDDTSRFINRTIFPTGAPTTFEIATYQRDALGFLWDIHRLNHLICRVFSYIGIADLIRVFKLFCEIKYRVRPTITVDAPTGSVYTPSPTISWTYTQTDGDPQREAEYKIFTAQQASQVSFNPQNDPPVFSQTVLGDITSVQLPTSINPNSYWVYVRSISSFGAKSVWVGRQFTVNGSSPGSPGIDDPVNLIGASIIGVVPDAEYGSASLTLRDTSNILSAQEADAEGTVDGASLTTTNCAVTRSTADAFPGGTASWRITATGAGTMAVNTDWLEVEGGNPLTARVQFKTASTARSARVRILFYDGAFNAVSGTLQGTNVTDSTSTWTEAVAYGTIPAGAVYAKAVYEVLAAAASEVHYIDHLGVMYGTNTPWSDGGHTSRNLLSSYLASAEGSANGESWIAANPATTTGTQTPPPSLTAGGSGSNCFKMTYVGTTPTIGYRGAGTAFTSPTSGTDFVLNKPGTTASGDLMLAFVASNEYGGINPPTGWTLVNQSRVNDASTDTAMFVLKRVAGGAEPASWGDGTLTAAASRRTAVVVSYSGAADVLVDTQASTADDTPLYLTTPFLDNTEQQGWRVSAFAVNDNAALAPTPLTANRQTPSGVPGITYVGKATAWTNTTNTSAYTINKPSGVVTGDLMVATLGAIANATVTPPSGWTMRLQSVANNTDSGPFTLAVMYRVATASEPTSWGGTISGTLYRTRVTQCVAYRNVHTTTPFISDAIKSTLSQQTLYTNSAVNNNSAAWRISAFGGLSSGSNSFSATNEVIERADSNANYSEFLGSKGGNTVMMADSNGPVGTGTYERYGTSASSLYGGVGYVGFLNPSATLPATVPNEAVRVTTANVGSSAPWLTMRVFDSGPEVAATGTQQMTGIFAPGSGTDKSSMAGWFGIIKPASAATAGYVAAETSTQVDVSLLDIDAIPYADKVSMTASFVGSAAGTPYLTVEFYRANVLLDTQVREGTSFGTSLWEKSEAEFDVPEGTTRMVAGVSVSDRIIGDIVYWDRVSLGFGEDTTYRAPTSKDEHPVWSRPQIQYADDDGTGYSEWRDLPGLRTSPPHFEPRSGEALYTDHTPIPLTNRHYRARAVSYGLGGDQFVSDWGPDSSEFSFVAENWWLKDIANPDNSLELKVSWDTTAVSTTNTATVFQAIGEELPVVLSEGYKGDTLPLVLRPVNHDEWAALRKMLKSGRTLFLQSDIDHAWWVRPIGDLQADVLPTGQRQSNPLRTIKCTFIQVEPQE